MTTGQLIKEARKKAGMTQKQLAEKLGVSYVNISQLENNQRTPKYKTVLSIATALGVDWMELVPDGTQGDMIADHMTELIKCAASSGKVSYHKLTDAEQYRAGFLKFYSDEDRIAYFYGLLNTDGKLIASRCFYQYLDKDKVYEVADYVEKLSEIPQYQRTEAPQSPPSPQGGTPPEDAESTQKPSEDKK